MCEHMHLQAWGPAFTSLGWLGQAIWLENKLS